MLSDLHINVDIERNKVRTAPLQQYKLKALCFLPHKMVENLICAVKKRSPLWDPSVEFYHNKNIINALWKEVAEEIGLSAKQARRGWNSVIECYHKELNKLQMSSENEQNNSNWVHFNSMSFLQESMLSKDSDASGNQSQKADENHIDVEEVVKSTESDMIYIQEEENMPLHWLPHPKKSEGIYNFNETLPHKTYTYKLRKHDEKYRKVMTDLENRRLNILEKNARMDEDDDLQFLKSLLPQIKMLSLSKKMGMRLKFQEIICKEIEDL